MVFAQIYKLSKAKREKIIWAVMLFCESNKHNLWFQGQKRNSKQIIFLNGRNSFNVTKKCRDPQNVGLDQCILICLSGCRVWWEQRENLLWLGLGGEKGSDRSQTVHDGSRPQTPAEEHQTSAAEPEHRGEPMRTPFSVENAPLLAIMYEKAQRPWEKYTVHKCTLNVCNVVLETFSSSV